MSINWDSVTDRIRAMVNATTPDDIADVAQRLGVSHVTLREGIEGRSRLSALTVIRALVKRGVDAKWMLTGDVDPSLHRRMLDATPQEIDEMIKRIIAEESRGGDSQPPGFLSPQ